ADILLPGEAAHILALAELARLLEPLTQIVVAKPRLEIRASRGIGGFGAADRGFRGVSLCGHSRSPGGGELTRGVAGVHPANRGPPFRMREQGAAGQTPLPAWTKNRGDMLLLCDFGRGQEGFG